MAKYIYLLQYNNYYNRTIKGYNNATVDRYIADGATLISTIPNCTLWNPADGVNTVLTSKIDMYSVPDYCVVCDEVKNVLSRWFVLEATRIQGGQYRLRLHRDLIADSYSVVMQNPDTYIERGWCDVSNSAIYNSEPFTFNEIKNKQRELYDKSLCPWIVMYFTPNKTIAGTESAFPDATVSANVDNGAGTMTIRYKYGAQGATTDTDTIRQLSDAPYAMMALPYATKTYYNGDTLLGTITRDQAMAIVQATSRKYSGAGWLMDVQLLPYCPCKEVLRSDGNIDVSKAVAFANIISYIGTLDGKLVGGALCCSASSFVQTLYSATGSIFSITIQDVKVENTAYKYRLVSPNGNGVFEFNPAKMVYANSTEVKFDAYCTYMPYQPYIKVVPRFGRLYGSQHRDYRGLICGGDFSLPQISDAWNTYQQQNKNYQAMFNRQIESMELQQNWSMASDIVGAVAGIGSAAIGGAIAGTMIMPGPGTIAGAAVGGLTSAVGGVMDVVSNYKLRADQKDAAIDQHNMQLGNIKALPYSVTKVNNFNLDNTYVPYLEIYVPDDYEIDNLTAYFKLRSYTINRYGALIDYKQATGRTWLQGQIIKINGINDDAHYVASLADEVKQGFYVGEEDNNA